MRPGVDAEPSSAARRAAAVHVVRALRAAGHVAYFAGGCVRDELLGLTPADYDVATDAPPERVQQLFVRTNAVGASFGVVLVKERRCVTEVATFRADGPYTDNRRPDAVRFASPTEDAHRRDFTINAMFLDPLAPEGERIIDLVGGRADLDARLVRAVGEPAQRLAEDHLRALRAVRFAARFGFAVEPATAEAVRRDAAALAGVSRERIGDEIRRMLAHPSRAAAARMVQSFALDAAIFGGDSLGVAPVPTLAGLPERVEIPTALAAWVVDRAIARVGTPDAVCTLEGARALRCRDALVLSNDETAAFERTLAALGSLRRDWPGMGEAARKRLAAAPGAAPARALLVLLDRAASARVEADLAQLAGRFGGLAPEPLLTGDDLVAAGYQPGRGFAALLDRVYDAQLEGRIAARADAMALAAAEAAGLGIARRPPPAGPNG